MLPDRFLPIKVVLPRPDFDYMPDPKSGGSTRIFQPVTRDLRTRLADELEEIASRVHALLGVHPEIPAVAKVLLRDDAKAKSYRPVELFNDESCPIIGGGSAAELLISVQEAGLARVKERIEFGATRKMRANISTIEHLLPFGQDDVFEDGEVGALTKASCQDGEPLRLRLFRHQSDAVNAAIDEAVIRIADEQEVDELTPLDYGDEVRVFAVRGASASAIRALGKFKGTQGISLFPQYAIFKEASHVVGTMDKKRFPPPRDGVEYGLVGLIDSGTDQSNAALQEYVVCREDWVPRSEQDNEHGTFVAGLLANPRALNNGNSRFPSVGSKIVDIVAVDRSGEISEYDLVTMIDKAVRKYPHVKVWNLSLGQDCPCKDERFSPLALKIDSLSKKRGVLFVIAAGNYAAIPLRGWPPADCGEDDRIGSPADSVRSLTVGSLAHIENQATCVRIDEPSPFTKRGPAPHFYIKPEVSGYAGNCDPSGDYLQSAVVSVKGRNQLAENIGTSFAAPSISSLAANVFRELEQEPDVSPVFVKSLLVHSAFLNCGQPKTQEVRYRGFGTPGDLFDVLNCTKSSATLIFHGELIERRWFDKSEFPMPTCLNVPRKGLRAEVFMTLAYDPPTDGRFSTEYCRTNVTASLGTVEKGLDGKDNFCPQVKPAPKEITKGYEDALVKEGFKWSPMKHYYRRFDSGPVGKRWRLHLELLNRSGVQCKEPQKIILLVTIRDPANLAFVYNAIVREMERLSWGAQDLRIATRLRQFPVN